MDNKSIFYYLGITEFHKQGFNGQKVKIGYWDLTTTSNSQTIEHYKLVHDILKQVAPHAELHYYKFSGNPESDLTKILNDGIHVLNISMTGIDIENPLVFKNQAELYSKVFIVAASGNTGKEEYNFPASNDPVRAITACTISNKKVIPVAYSAINNKVDNTMPTALWLTKEISGLKQFTGTSCSAPLMSGCVALIMSAFAKKFYAKNKLNQMPDIWEINKMLDDMSVDVHSEGYDINTGKGIVILDESKIHDYYFDTKEEAYKIKGR